ncbi:hypothetical protein OBBRIDRAFT_808777 [Obba rivulosa]|uniref:DUF6533 domain-containing protein n=1 Tax=Obba rivulosa TaxID=1052685 RepID=A0A8E2AKX3_9APHY|nr:hypothetical protein OBBRIDRAFT_808777 [Obba rivulosa]
MSNDASHAEEQLGQTALQLFSVNLAGSAALAWVVFDVVLTIEQEVRYVWRRKWTLQKVLYLVVRYYTIFALSSMVAGMKAQPSMFFLHVQHISVNTNTNLSLKFCRFWLRFNVYGTLNVIAGIGEIMFLTRIYAAYEQSRKMLVFLIFLWLLEIIVAYAMAYVEVTALVVLPHPPGYPFSGCISSLPRNNKISLIAWIADFIVSSTFLALILFQFFRSIDVQSVFKLPGPRHIWEFQRLAPVLWLIMRDGLLYFFMVVASVTVDMVFVSVLPLTSFSQAGVMWVKVSLSATMAVAACRLYLNLHDRISGNDSMTFTVGEIEIEFLAAATSSEHMTIPH